MLERLKDCLCHPKFLGKYNKDYPGIVFLTIFIFFVLFAAMFAARCYTDAPFDDSSSQIITSQIIRQGGADIVYDAEKNVLQGQSIEFQGEGYRLVFLPSNAKMTMKFDEMTILFKEELAEVYYSNMKVSSIAYQDITVSGFNLKDVASNATSDIYSFKLFVGNILNSANIFFQTFSFIQGMVSIVLYYLICVLFSVFLSIAINPTIDRGVRIKLCFYDGCVFFVGSFFAHLFAFEMLVYFSLLLPMVYTLITFRHIVRIVIKN